MKKICLLMMVFLLGACTNEKPAEIEAIDVKEEVSRKEEEKIITHIDEDKKETVYVSADAYGNIRKCEVEVILKSEGENNIEDVSDLKNIRNTGSDESFTCRDGVLLFENKGEDIHYKGQSEKPLPVDVKISYYLNNREIEVDELAGKSGRVKIRFDYSNNTLNENGMIAPFMAVSMVMLDSDKFSDIEVKNGKLLQMGDSKVALITSLPDLADKLKLRNYELTRDIKLENYGYIEADVHDFSLDYTVTLLSNGLLKELKDEDLNDLLDFAEKTEDFKKDANELTDNTGKLYDASIKIKNAMSKYVDGVQKIGEGMSSAADGGDQLKQTIDLLNSLPQTVSMLQSVNEEIAADKDENNEAGLISAIRRIVPEESAGEEEKEKIRNIREALEKYFFSIDENISSAVLENEDAQAYLYGEGQETLKLMFMNYISNVTFRETLKAVVAGAEGLSSGLNTLKEGTFALSGYNSEIKNGLSELADAAKEFDDGMKDFVNNDINDFLKLGGSSLRTVINNARAMKIIDENYGCFTGLMEGKKGSVTFIIETDEIK